MPNSWQLSNSISKTNWLSQWPSLEFDELVSGLNSRWCAMFNYRCDCRRGLQRSCCRYSLVCPGINKLFYWIFIAGPGGLKFCSSCRDEMPNFYSLLVCEIEFKFISWVTMKSGTIPVFTSECSPRPVCSSLRFFRMPFLNNFIHFSFCLHVHVGKCKLLKLFSEVSPIPHKTLPALLLLLLLFRTNLTFFGGWSGAKFSQVKCLHHLHAPIRFYIQKLNNGSHLWSPRGQMQGWCHHQKLFPSVFFLLLDSLMWLNII